MKVDGFDYNYEMGNIMFYPQFLDWDGNEVERTPDKYRYSYDAYVTYKKADKYKHAAYSDRLFQHDYKKYNKLCKKHFGNEGQYWDDRSEKKIQAFLRDFYGKPKLELVGIMNGCNASNGFPYWVFMFDCEF